MDIVFMGTPEFAVPSLLALTETDNNVKAVFTQPDKPKGRGYKTANTPIKEAALSHNIPVYQPASLKSGVDAEVVSDALKRISPELIVVVAYGKVLPKEILEFPEKGCVNVHASLLPKYRGAAPIQRCIMNGERETGITVMRMDEGIDTGDMLAKNKLEISENETASHLHDRLALLGAKLLVETLELIKVNKISPEKQDDSLSSYAPIIDKSVCRINFSKPAYEVHNIIRGLSSRPGAYAYLNGKRLKIYGSELEKGKSYTESPGTIVNEKYFTVVCGDGNALILTELQFEGCKRLSVGEFVKGNRPDTVLNGGCFLL